MSLPWEVKKDKPNKEDQVSTDVSITQLNEEAARPNPNPDPNTSLPPTELNKGAAGSGSDVLLRVLH